MLLTFFIFATEGLPDVLIFYLKHDLSQGDGIVGGVLAIAALGTVAGALFVAPLTAAAGLWGRAGRGRCWCAGWPWAAWGCRGACRGWRALAAVYLGCTSVAGICSMSLRQQITPDHLLGRVTAAFWTIHFSLGPVGVALLTWTASRFGVEVACVASAAACLLLARSSVAHPSQAASPGTGSGCHLSHL